MSELDVSIAVSGNWSVRFSAMTRQVKRGKAVVVTGPSGVGKSTIVREVVRRTGAVLSVSATTRALRKGEVDYREYHFVDRVTFEEMVALGEMLEWAEVYGQLYGTPAYPVREAIREGKTVLLEIDVQGGLQVHEKLPTATFVLIAPPAPEVLAKRLGQRGTEDPQALERRLAKADSEMKVAGDSGVYTHHVVNDDLETAIEEVVGIVNQESGK